MHFQKLFLVPALCFLLLFPVCAAGSDLDPLDPSPDSDSADSVVLPVSGSSSADIAAALSQALTDFSDREPDEIIAFSLPLMDLDSGIAPASVIDPSDVTEPAGTLKSILTNIIGPYNPVVVQYRYQTTTSGNYSYIREIQPDWIWVCSCAMFALLIYCTFRLGGALLRKT